MTRNFYDPSPFTPGKPGWTGEIGWLRIKNDTSNEVTIKLYTPANTTQAFVTFNLVEGSSLFFDGKDFFIPEDASFAALTAASSKGVVAMNWGIQVDDSNIRILGLISSFISPFSGGELLGAKEKAFTTTVQRVILPDASSAIADVFEDLYYFFTETLTTNPNSSSLPEKNPLNARDEIFLTVDLPGLILDLKEFENPWSSVNLAGSTAALENFSILVDNVPLLSKRHGLSGNSVDKLYGEILGAQSQVLTSNPAENAKYEEAYNFLYTDTITPDPLTGAPKKVKIETLVYRTYLDKKALYENAFQAYTTAFQQYSATEPLKWSSIGPELERQVNESWTELQSVRAKGVEAALDILRQAPLSTVATMLSKAREIWENTKRSSLSDAFLTWHPTSAFPNHWFDDSLLSNYATYTSQTVSFKYLQVEIRRPWLNPSIFSLGGWSLPAREAGSYSTGRVKDNNGIFPLLPTGFILARDFSINAFSDGQIKTVLSSPGPQIIAWINKLIPFCPPKLG